MTNELVAQPGSEGIASDDFWIILTLLSMPPESLIEHLPGRIPSEESPYLDDGRYNPLVILVSVASTRYISWYDEFLDCERLIESLAKQVAAYHASRSDYIKYSREALFESEWWDRVRYLSREILKCSGAGPRPNLPAKIDPSEFDEFPPHCYDCDYDSLDPKF